MTGDTAKVSQTYLVDSDKQSQAATGREPNRSAGQHRSSSSLSLSGKGELLSGLRMCLPQFLLGSLLAIAPDLGLDWIISSSVASTLARALGVMRRSSLGRST
jgi:hypothetical protein